jgi:ribose transport system substrate-binding protein
MNNCFRISCRSAAQSPFAKRLAGLLLILLLGGCGQGSNSTGDSATGRGSDQPRVALIMKSLANEFFSTMAEGAKRHQAESGEYQLIVNGIKDERDLSRQVALVEEMIALGVDAIVIAPADSKALVPVLRRAQNAGVVVVNIDNRLDADVLAQEEVSIPFVGPDNRLGARKVGEYLASQLSAGDQVAILEGIRTSFNAQQRLIGFQEAMQQAGMVIVASQSADWEMSMANTIASSILSEHPEIRAILAANDSMALGAIAAVKGAGKTGQVRIVGFDNIKAIQEAIRDGSALATADQHGDELAVFGIQTALAMLAADQKSGMSPDGSSDVQDSSGNGLPPSASPVVETPVDLITAESL